MLGTPSPARPPGFDRGDLDGFFGLMVDNLLQFLVILPLCTTVCGFSAEFVLERVFPGAALSIVAGNFYYAWQARALAARTGRRVTALPYGINTVSLFAFVLFVIGPTYQDLAADPAYGPERAAHVAWQVGLVACFLSGAIEIAGAFVADWVRRVTPRAALLSTLAGIALGFISMEFVLRSFDRPLVAFAPLALVLVSYLARMRWPFGLPGGMIAVLLGTAIAWTLQALGMQDPPAAALPGGAGFRPPVPSAGDLFAALGSPHVWNRIGVVLPMGLINVLGSLQNVESAAAEGDAFSTRASLNANGLGSIVAACFGSCFPTTIYIGHPGWKRMGAGWGYSALNGAFFAVVATTGLIAPIARLVPVEAAMAILVWIAVIITTQAFTATPREHAPAVVLGLLPGIAAWGWFLVETGLTSTLGGRGLGDAVGALGAGAMPYVRGLLSLKAGFLFSGTFLAAIAVFLAERRFGRAALWAATAGAFALAGLMHTYTITPGAIREEILPGAAWPLAAGYFSAALVFLLAARLARPVAATIDDHH